MRKDENRLETNLLYSHACNYCKCFCKTIHRKSGKRKAYIYYKAYQHAYYSDNICTLDNEQMDLLHNAVVELLQADWLASRDTARKVYKTLNNAYYKTYIPAVDRRTDGQQARHDNAVKRALSQRLNSAQRQALKSMLNESLVDIATPVQCKAIIAVLNDRYNTTDEQALRRLGYKLDIPDIQPPTPTRPTPQPPTPHSLLCVRPTLTVELGHKDNPRCAGRLYHGLTIDIWL